MPDPSPAAPVLADGADPLVEVRVPTYRRPAWLAECLASLSAQTHARWRAVVLDDDPDRSAAAVVRRHGDDRVVYEPNPQNRGAAGNLDAAFVTGPRLGGAFACVVEDDNWLLPDCLRANVAALNGAGLNLLARNQEVWDRRLDERTRAGHTTLGHWYTPGVIEPVALHAGMFLFPGVSNGSLFWRTAARSELAVGAGVTEPSLQEYCRCGQIVEPVLFAPEPLAVYAEVKAGVVREARPTRSFGRFLQRLWRGLVRTHGPAVIDAAYELAERTGKVRDLEAALLNALIRPRRPLSLPVAGAAARVVRGAVKLAVVRDPSPHYRLPPVPGSPGPGSPGRPGSPHREAA